MVRRTTFSVLVSLIGAAALIERLHQSPYGTPLLGNRGHSTIAVGASTSTS